MGRSVRSHPRFWRWISHRLAPRAVNALTMLASTLVLQCANTIDRRTVAPCRATSAPRLLSRNVAPTDSTSAKSRRTRLEAFNALAIWSWTCCPWTPGRESRNGDLTDFVEFSLFTGLRRGEALGLTWGCRPDSCGKEKWRILPVGEVNNQPAACQGGHRRNAPWARVSGRRPERMRSRESRWAN